MTSFTQRALKMVASVSDGLPPLQLQDFREIDKANFNIVFSTHDPESNYKEEDFHEALASATDNKLGIVEGSLFKMPGVSQTYMRCIASANREVLPYTDEVQKQHKMKPLHANVIEDGNGGIWRLVSNNGKQSIVQVSQDNYGELLAKRREFAQLTASVDDEFDIGFTEGDYLYFFNPKIEAMDFGFCVTAKTGTWALSKATKEAVQIKPHQVMEACSTDGKGLNLAAKRRELTAADTSLKGYLEYLKGIYPKEYVREWEKLIKSSSSRVK